MPTLFFPERDTLRLVLASGGVAAPVTQTPAEAGWDAQGRLWLTTGVALPRETMAVLQRFGVRIVGSSAAATTESIACWQQLLPLEKSSLTPELLTGAVLFNVPGAELSSLLGEVERGRVKAYSFRWLDDIAGDNGSDRMLVKIESPPYFTLLRTAENSANGLLAFVEQAPRVWVSAGWRHLFASQIRPPAGKMLLLHASGKWEWRDERPFQTAEVDATRQAPPSHSELVARSERQVDTADGVAPIPIPLRLTPTDDAASAEMWIIRDATFPWLERFLQGTDESLLQRFTCAVAADDGNPVLVLRVRGKGPAPILVEAPIGYRPFLKLANLFVPCGYALAPLPRRDTIRQLLAVDPTRLTWLRPLDGGSFVAESVAIGVFRPLMELVEYRLENASQSLRPWLQVARWSFERFVVRTSAAVAPSQRPESVRTHAAAVSPAPVRDDKAGGPGWLSRTFRKLFRVNRKPKVEIPQPAADDLPPIPVEEAVRTALPSPPVRGIERSLKFDEAKARIRSITSRFHESLEEMTPAKRLELWPELAAAFAHANHQAEAALCWLNALWEQDRPSPLWAWGWLKAEAAQAGWNPHAVDLNRWLAAPADKSRPRAVAAFALWAAVQEVPPEGFEGSLTQLNAYLDAYEDRLPIRAAWLVRTALARSTRGDVLGLAHTRDRLLARLRDHGLSLAQDVPAFVRNAGSEDIDRLNQVGKWLAAKRRTINEWIASLGPEAPRNATAAATPRLYELEAEVRCTQAYADLMIAWGLNRLGESNEADRVRAMAHESLADADPIHGWLRAAFDFRLKEARENLTANPLPSELQAQLGSLTSNDLYRVNRLRQRSRILEPVENVDVWASTMQQYRGWDALRRQLLELPALEGPELNRRVKLLLEQADREEPSTRPAVLLAVLALPNRVDRALTELVLDRALAMPVGSPIYLRILERAIPAAAALGLDGKVRLLAHRFASYVEEQRGQGSPELLEGLTGQTFRCLRKLGMKEEADNVLSKIALWLTRGMDLKDLRRSRPNDWPVLLRTLLHVAAGWYFCGRSTQGHRIIEEARTRDLFEAPTGFYDRRTLVDRAALAVAYASTIGQIPAKIALGYFEELFLRLRNIAVSGWNSHFTLQPLELVDTVIRAVVSDDFSLGPAIRGWLDDDEFNVRQRIHREMGVWMEQQGI